MIFSIAMGADCSFYVKSIATYAPAFFGYNSSVLASVNSHRAAWKKNEEVLWIIISKFRQGSKTIHFSR